MVNAEILQAFLWHISLYSHSLEDIDTEEVLITQARYFIGIDLGLLREGYVSMMYCSYSCLILKGKPINVIGAVSNAIANFSTTWPKTKKYR